MAKSNAQKMRAHKERNGLRNPESNRGVVPGFSTHVRKTPSIHEKRIKDERKYKQSVRAYF
ncbi:hypothetical protein RKD55_004560 [Rossellomorea marisflavi]